MNEKLFPLDWKSRNVVIDNQYVHSLRRPETPLLLERDKEFNFTIQVKKNLKLKRPDQKVINQIDLKYYEAIRISASGYDDKEPPNLHKLVVFRNLFLNSFSLAERRGEEISVIEHGSVGIPIQHILRKPTNEKAVEIKEALKDGDFVMKKNKLFYMKKSNLEMLMDVYSEYFLRIEKATVDGKVFSQELRKNFIEKVCPLAQKEIVKFLVKN